jgi:hypothetical protein
MAFEDDDTKYVIRFSQQQEVIPAGNKTMAEQLEKAHQSLSVP